MEESKKGINLIKEAFLQEINAGSVGDEEVRTVMRCEYCGYEDIWAGNYLNGQMYVCPEKTATYPVFGRCFAPVPSFHGISFHHYKE